MVVFAANISDETTKLIEELMYTKKFNIFSRENRLNLSDNTILIRLAMINLIKNLPSNKKVQKYKIALTRPSEFDNFLKDELWTIKKCPKCDTIIPPTYIEEKCPVCGVYWGKTSS